MLITILATKLYIPPPRPNVVRRVCLTARLDDSLALGRTPGVILVSAPAGYGKTTLISEWVAGCQRPVAWLSLDEGDSDLIRFLTYLLAALRTVMPHLGAGVESALQSPQPSEPILTALH